MPVTIPHKPIIDRIRGKRVGVLSNSTFWLEGYGDDLPHLASREAKETILLYAEHGIRNDGDPSNPPPEELDPDTGCPLRDLYKLSFRDENTDGLIDDLDLIVIGLVDVGVRHYSFKRIMCALMELAGEKGIPVIVVDSPNSIGGEIIEGNMPDPAYYPTLNLPVRYGWFGAPTTYRHGMTMGELALYGKDYLKLDLDLDIIEMEGWRRSMFWDETGLPFLPFDPSIGQVETCHLFGCTGLLQGSSISWGLGTTEPFGLVGAPWMDDRLLEAMRKANIPHAAFTRAYFIPRWNIPGAGASLWRRFALEQCQGVRIHLLDKRQVETQRIQLNLLHHLFTLYPDQFTVDTETHRFHVRLESLPINNRLMAGEKPEVFLDEWTDDCARFREIRQPHLIYE